MLYTIGEFSQMVRVTIKTLHYYDSISLFSPIELVHKMPRKGYEDKEERILNILFR